MSSDRESQLVFEIRLEGGTSLKFGPPRPSTPLSRACGSRHRRACPSPQPVDQFIQRVVENARHYECDDRLIRSDSHCHPTILRIVELNFQCVGHVLRCVCPAQPNLVGSQWYFSKTTIGFLSGRRHTDAI
jgi:hypothetical protein